MNNIRNEDCNIILRDKILDNSISHRHLINDLVNENFLRDNDKILNNHFMDTKRNFRNSMENLSSKGFFLGSPEQRNNKIIINRKSKKESNLFY